MKNWKWIKLGDSATFVNGYPFKPTEWSEDGLEIIRIQNLTEGSFQTNYFGGKINEKYKVTKGDILISWSATLGVYEWQNDDAWLNQHIFKVIFNKTEWDKLFFKYLIKSILNFIGSQVHGATMKHITKKKFDEIQIPLPPLEEQKRIAAKLVAADLHRQKTKELIAKYDELAQALFLDIIGDPVTNPKGWEKVRLGKYCKIQGGNSFKSTDFTTTGVKLVKISNVHFEKLLWTDLEYLPFEYLEKYKEFSLNEGDILMALTRPIIQSMGTVKAVKVNKKDLPCLLNQRVARFFPNTDKVSKDYLLRIIYSEFFKNEISKLSSTSLQPNVSNRQVENIEILIPPITIQNDFELKNTTIQNQKLQAEQSLQKAEELFQSLLQKAFKGEL